MTEEITTTSWFTRLKDALIGIFIGIALIIGAIFLVFWNEGHSLHMAQSLEQTKNLIISAPIVPVNNQNNLKVIYLNGLATTKDNLSDPILGVTVNAINLNRKIEMYQWEQKAETKTEKQVGGSEKKTTTYTYNKTWSETLISSSDFKTPEGHQNPTSMPIQSQIQYAKTVTIGDFSLPEELIKQINNSQAVDLAQVNKDALKTQFNKAVTLTNNVLYLGQDPQNPQPGDLRISLTDVAPQTVSIIAQQTNTTLQPFLAPAGQRIMLLSTGQHSPEEMIQQAKSQNSITAWGLRLTSLILLIIGFALIMNPIVVLADVLPFLGSIVGFGTGLIAFLCGLSIWLIAIAIAWFTVRPLLSIGLLVLMVLSWFGLGTLRSKKTPMPPTEIRG